MQSNGASKWYTGRGPARGPGRVLGPARGGRVQGGGRERERSCKFCLNLCIPGPHDHYLRDYSKSNSPITCPRLLNITCGICKEKGHTKTYCPQKGRGKREPRDGMDVVTSKLAKTVVTNKLKRRADFPVEKTYDMAVEDWPVVGGDGDGDEVGDGDGVGDGIGDGIGDEGGDEGGVGDGVADKSWVNVVELCVDKKVSCDPVKMQRFKERREKLFSNNKVCRDHIDSVDDPFVDSDGEYGGYDDSYFGGQDMY